MLRLFMLATLAMPTVTAADERAPGIVAVGSRLFLAPGQVDHFPGGVLPPDAPGSDVLPPDMPGRGVFLSPDTIDGVREVLEADPLLSRYRLTLQIGRSTQASPAPFRDEVVTEWFDDVERVPDELRLEGLDVRTMGGDAPPNIFSFRPVGPEPDFMLVCNDYPDSAPDDAFDLCMLDASYPFDPFIRLGTEMERAPVPQFALDAAAIAERMREVALCLDVTAAPPANPEAALAALLATNPTLEGCADAL